MGIVPKGRGSEDGGGEGLRKTGSTVGPASINQSGSSTSSALRQKSFFKNLKQNFEGGLPGRSSDRIHSVSGADLLEQTWSHQRRLFLLLLQLFCPQQHQLPSIVISLPLGCHVVPLQVPVREDRGPSRSVEGSMVDCSWGNTGPCLRGLSTTQHTVGHTQFIAFLSLGVQYLSGDYMVSREEGASQLRRGGPGSSPA